MKKVRFGKNRTPSKAKIHVFWIFFRIYFIVNIPNMKPDGLNSNSLTVLLLTWIKILPHSQIVLDGKIFIVDIPKMDYFLFLFFFRIVTIKGHLCRLAKHNHQVEHDEEVKRILHWHFDNSLYTFKEVSFFRNTFYESVKKLLMTSYRFCLMIVYLFLSKSI